MSEEQQLWNAIARETAPDGPLPDDELHRTASGNGDKASRVAAARARLDVLASDKNTAGEIRDRLDQIERL